MRTIWVALLLIVGAAAPIAQKGQLTGELITPSTRDPDSTGPFPVLRSGLWGYIDHTGAITIAPQFDDAGFFHEGRAAIQANGLWGYIDSAGHPSIPPRFMLAARFSDGLAAVRWKDAATGQTQLGYVDASGGVAITCSGNNLDEQMTAAQCSRPFESGYVAEAVEVFRCLDLPGNPQAYPCQGMLIDRWGYYDKRGKLAIAGPFGSGARPFSDGLAAVQRYGSQGVGFIDPSGSFVIALGYDQAQPFSEGLAAVRRGALWGFIDRFGQSVIDARFQNPSRFAQGLAAVSEDGRWGFIDRNGRFTIPPRFQEVGAFSQGLAAVCCDEGYTRYIDASGQWAFDTRLRRGISNAGPFIDGIALVDVEASGPAYIDRSGRIIALVRARD